MISSRRAFSLVELLLAVFILGIGIIGISALFPAGIAQQRQANDDIMGPIVADNAMAILRTKLKPEWFGTMEEFGSADLIFPNGQISETFTVTHHPTVPGDWEWKRPGFLFQKLSADAIIDERGAIDIFSAYYTSNQLGGLLGLNLDLSKIATENYYGTGASPTSPLFGIPYNFNNPTLDFRIPGIDNSPTPKQLPKVLIFQSERAYPNKYSGAGKTKRPAFYWDCMFRRFAGRIQVAIFVYRVVDGGGEPRDYIVSQGSTALGTSLPPIPILFDLSIAPFAPWKFGGLDGLPLTFVDNAKVLNPTPTTTPGNIAVEQSWEFPGQWILDEYNTVHRVLTGRKTSKDGPVILTRPVPAHPPLAELFGVTYTAGTTVGAVPADPGDRFIWFVPMTDPKGFTLVPVYASVQEL